jgi:hypothetical protein
MLLVLPSTAQNFNTMLTDAHQHLPPTFNGTCHISVQFPTQIKCFIVSVDKIAILIKNWSGVLGNVNKNFPY